MNAITWPDAKGDGMDQIVDDGGDATLLAPRGRQVREGLRQGRLAARPGVDGQRRVQVRAHDHQALDAEGQARFTRMVERMVGVSEETTTGVHRLIQMADKGELLFPAINVNDCVTKSKFDNVYGCRHSLPDGIMRATDVMLAGKRAVICGYGDVGKGSAAMKAARRRSLRDRDRPDLRAPGVHGGLPGQDTMEVVRRHCDIVITTTGNKDIITCEHMSKMKNNAIVGNIGHFDNEIQMEQLEKATTRMNIKPQCIDKPQVDIFPDGHGVIVLAEGRLLNLGCATGHPSFVMSNSFTNQTLAQLELWKEKDSGKYFAGGPGKYKVYTLPKILDEKVAALHLTSLGASSPRRGFPSHPRLLCRSRA